MNSFVPALVPNPWIGQAMRAECPGNSPSPRWVMRCLLAGGLPRAPCLATGLRLGRAYCVTVRRKARDAANKKTPAVASWGLGCWWSRRESNPRPKVFCDQFYVCSDVIEISLPLRRRTGSTSNQPP